MKKSWWQPLLKYVLGFGLLAAVVWLNWRPGGNNKGLADALEQEIHYGPLLFAGLVCMGSLLLTFVRWFLLVRAQDLPFTLGNALRLGMVGNFFNTFLPGAVGGDLIKMAFIAREQSRRTAAIATIILDRALGLCGLVWVVAVLGGLFWLTGTLDALTRASPTADELAWGEAATYRLKGIAATALALALASVVFWLWLRHLTHDRAAAYAARLHRLRWAGPTLAEFWRALWMYRWRGRVVGLALAMAMLGHLGFILVFYLAALTLLAPDAIPPLQTHCLLVPVGLAIQAGIPSPGGVGGGELGFGELYKLFGAAFSDGVLASLVQRAITWVLGLTGYLVYLRMRPALPVVVGQEQHPDPQPLASDLRCGR